MERWRSTSEDSACAGTALSVSELALPAPSADKPRFLNRDWSPADLFELFFGDDDDVISLLVINNEKYTCKTTQR